MLYCSIDIETAGLGRNCSLLEFGAVIDDLANPKPIDKLPSFHTYILNENIIGEPYALALHQKILDRIAKKEKPWSYESTTTLPVLFYDFLLRNNYKKDKDGKIEITVAGKNFAMFDKDWLLPIFKHHIKINHRVIDPAMLYYKLGDETLPNTKECMKRAGLEGEVAHTALEDSIGVVKLLRKYYHK